ncbi:MAG: L-threonylcarbamoyladenylate synthase [Candidatus Binataceae bacterium]
MAEKNSVAIADALAALAAGEAIVYPTETFYALGVDALSLRALDRLFAIKGREPGKPVALIAADTAMAFAVAREVPAQACVLAQAFWPGPLTLVLPARAEIPAPLVGTDGGVGVRVSSHPIARALAAGLRSPLTATSANLAGEPPASEIEMARRAFACKIKVFVEDGALAGGSPSTVVAVDRSGIRILRPGAVTERQLAAARESGLSK